MEATFCKFAARLIDEDPTLSLLDCFKSKYRKETVCDMAPHKRCDETCPHYVFTKNKKQKGI
jgi:hypothetical protein